MSKEITRMVKCTCKKCGETFKIDIDQMSREEVETWLAKDTGGFQCPGHHVELGKRSNYWTIDWNSLYEDAKPDDEKWLKKLIQNRGNIWSTNDLSLMFEVIGFATGYCIAKNKTTGKEICLDYTCAPVSGKRYYYVA